MDTPESEMEKIGRFSRDFDVLCNNLLHGELPDPASPSDAMEVSLATIANEARYTYITVRSLAEALEQLEGQGVVGFVRIGKEWDDERSK